MLLLKQRWVGGILNFFGPPRLNMKKVHLTSSEAKRVLLWFVLYFSGLKRLNWMKIPPLESSLEFSESINYENNVNYSLIRARKIQE